jgi:hypothetical protein
MRASLSSIWWGKNPPDGFDLGIVCCKIICEWDDLPMNGKTRKVPAIP